MIRQTAYLFAMAVLAASCARSAPPEPVSTAPASPGPEAAQLVAARQAGMRMMVFTVAALSRAATDETAPVSRAGFAIGGVEKFAQAMPVLFDTGTAAMDDNAALPQIWSDRPGFDAQVAQFQQATAALAAASAADDRAAFAAALASTKDACKACHDSYRAADD